MKYLLDTNTWIRFFSDPNALSDVATESLAEEGLLALSTISLVEVTQKAATGKLTFRVSLAKWMETALPPHRIELLSISPDIAREAHSLGDAFHGDPADRIITATARVHGLTVVTADKKLIRFDGLKTLSTR